ncbi:UNVERIFIED_CONTAM: hypothetical protein HDU68_008974 [Siphonaria sp. JEL0065]|nr:hypothetical protein HDU68_008974 [Siphonaria sp. JEL0065]
MSLERSLQDKEIFHCLKIHPEFKNETTFVVITLILQLMDIPHEFFFHLTIAVGAFSVLELIFLLHFVVYEETLKQGKPVNEIYKPFASILMLANIAMIGLFACEACLLVNETALIHNIQNLCTIVIESGYIYYSYLRAKPIFAEVFPSVSRPVAFIVKATPLLFGVQWLGTTLSREFQDPKVSMILKLFARGMTVLNGAILISFDMLSIHDLVSHENHVALSKTAEKAGQLGHEKRNVNKFEKVNWPRPTFSDKSTVIAIKEIV